MAINWFDIITASLVIIIGIKGIFNGLIKELAGLIGIILGVLIASTFAENFGSWLGEKFIHIDSHAALSLIGFLILLAIIWIGFLIAGALISKLVSLSGLGIADRIFGFLFASGKVFIIISVIVFALSNIDIVKKNTSNFTQKSLLYPFFIKTGSMITHIDSDTLKRSAKRIQDGTRRLVKKSSTLMENSLEGSNQKVLNEKK